jgi:hypothetical protein
MHRSKNLVWTGASPAGGFIGERLEGGRFLRREWLTGFAAETEK